MKSTICPSHALASSDAEVLDVSTLKDITRALDVLQECLLIIDTHTEKVTWCSSAFSERFPSLEQGMALDKFYSAFEGLERCLPACDSGSASNQYAQSLSVCYQGHEYFDVDWRAFSKDKQVLRLKDSTERIGATQRYLEDREQLFSISRSVSVSEMATTLAHEINQPIGTISNLLRGIRMRLKKSGNHSSDVSKAIDRAIDQTRFAAKIITRIRDYTHSRQPRKQSLDLSALVRACVSLMDWEIKRESIKLKMDTGNKPIPVSGDEVMLQQVFVNLIRNAIDAMTESPHADRVLHIDILIDDREAEVMIMDTGCGLSAAAETSLFVPFVSNKPSGMGVGLNICRSFIELHQGRLWLSSNEGCGCTSHVILPLTS